MDLDGPAGVGSGVLVAVGVAAEWRGAEDATAIGEVFAALRVLFATGVVAGGHVGGGASGRELHGVEAKEAVVGAAEHAGDGEAVAGHGMDVEGGRVAAGRMDRSLSDRTDVSFDRRSRLPLRRAVEN